MHLPLPVGRPWNTMTLLEVLTLMVQVMEASGHINSNTEESTVMRQLVFRPLLVECLDTTLSCSVITCDHICGVCDVSAASVGNDVFLRLCGRWI